MSALLALLGAIPGIGSIVTFIVGKVFDAKVAITTAKIGGDRDTAVAIINASAVAEHERTAALGVIAGSTILTLLVVAFAGPLVIFMWKVIVWDIVLGLGTTDPIRGQVAEWANTIILSIFGSGTVLAAGKMALGWLSKRS
jgi:hypothetical protein